MAVYDLRGWVDLGLPSGKLWCFDNEEGYFTFDEAVEKFQDQLPTTGFYIEDRRFIVPECGCYWSADLAEGDIPTLCGSVRTAKNFVFNTINNRVFTNTFYWNYCDCRLAVRLIKSE